MSTLRESIQNEINEAQTKVADAQNTVVTLQAELAGLEVNASSFLSTEVEALKDWFAVAAKHLGL